MSVDDLEGSELARAVATKIGLIQDERHPRWWDDEDGYGLCIDDGEPLYRGGKPVLYRPDRDIAQAWGLDGKGWDWDFSENVPRSGWLEALVNGTGHEDGLIIVHLNMTDFPTKANAYATARCRAYLKARKQEG